MFELSQLAQNPWFLVFLGVVLGGTIFMWGDYLLRKLLGSSSTRWPRRHVDELEIVANKRFVSTSVRLDGRRFIGCTFRDTLIQWDGEEFRTESCDLSQGNHFVTHNRRLQVMLELGRQIGLINPSGYRHLRGHIAEAQSREGATTEERM